MNQSLRTIVVTAMCLGFILLGTVSTISYKSLQNLLKTQDWIEQTHVILTASHQLLAALKDVEAGHRGHALSNDRRYLASLPALRASVPPLVDRLRKLVAHNPSQLRRLNAIEPLIAAKMELAVETVRLREKEGFESAARFFNTNRGKVLMNQIEYVMREFQDQEGRLLEERRALSNEDAHRTFRTIGLTAAVALLMGVGWAVLVDRSIRQKEKTETALRGSEERLNIALDSAKMGVWELDLNTDRATRTLRHDQIFGYETMQTEWGLERFMKEHVAPEHQPIVEQAFAAAYDADNKSGSYHLECPITRKDGALRWILAEGSLYRDARGRPARMMGVVTDVTENKDKAAALLRAVAELEAANKELEAFSYSVSHDLRAPLRSIDGFSQAVLEDCAGKLSAESAAHLGRVRAATQRMAQLIDDILQLSRISLVAMRPVSVDLSVLASRALEELAQAAPERRVDVSVTPDLRAQGDERLLRLALTNLLDNAWKFTSKTPDARIEFSSFLQPDGTSVFYIRDNGAGFDPVYAHKLFGAFQRLHAESEFPGTGVGLATVQRVTRRHGGRVWAESSSGKGATFYFTIPNPIERAS